MTIGLIGLLAGITLSPNIDSTNADSTASTIKSSYTPLQVYDDVRAGKDLSGYLKTIADYEQNFRSTKYNVLVNILNKHSNPKEDSSASNGGVISDVKIAADAYAQLINIYQDKDVKMPSEVARVKKQAKNFFEEFSEQYGLGIDDLVSRMERKRTIGQREFIKEDLEGLNQALAIYNSLVKTDISNGKPIKKKIKQIQNLQKYLKSAYEEAGISIEDKKAKQSGNLDYLNKMRGLAEAKVDTMEWAIDEMDIYTSHEDFALTDSVKYLIDRTQTLGDECIIPFLNGELRQRLARVDSSATAINHQFKQSQLKAQTRKNFKFRKRKR